MSLLDKYKRLEFPLLEINLLGTRTIISVEESRRLRRIKLSRRKLIFGEEKEVGAVHIAADQIDQYIAALQKGKEVLESISGDGVEEAAAKYGARMVSSDEQSR
jgi:hypothetical protein